jgi:hypothetical protein
MSENKGKDKLKKLKNKKKDVISINPLEILGQNSLKNNFKDKTKEEIQKEKRLIEENKLNSQPLSSKQIHTQKEINKNIENKNGNQKYILPENKNSLFLMQKIVSQIEYLFSYNDILEEKIYKLLVPLLSVNDYNNILEERETLDICGNFLCGKKIVSKVPEGVYSDDSISKKFDNVHLDNMFCSKECFDKFQKLVKFAAKNYKLSNLLSIDTILLFEALQDYYEKDEELTRISELGDNLLETYIRENKKDEKEIRNYCKKKRIELSKIFVDNFEEILKEKGIIIQ